MDSFRTILACRARNRPFTTPHSSRNHERHTLCFALWDSLDGLDGGRWKFDRSRQARRVERRENRVSRDRCCSVFSGSLGQNIDLVGKALKSKFGYEICIIPDAGKDQIVEALRSLRTEVGEKDQVIIYYAGHGYLNEKSGVGYWLPGQCGDQFCSQLDINERCCACIEPHSGQEHPFDRR
ncbi:hypothetical protein CCP2SC5_370007 [Azospirillaceae bacterium]